jgi:hypothetical protein
MITLNLILFFQDLSQKIGDEVAKQSSMVENAFQAQRVFLVIYFSFWEPPYSGKWQVKAAEMTQLF